MKTRLLLVVGLLFLLAPAGTAQAATQHVAMENYAYSPASLTVTVGDTVTWTNHDQAPHDVVTTSAPAAFRSPLLNTGESWSFTFTVPGTYSYYCSVHPDMRAEIIVAPAAEAPAPAPAPAPAQEQEAAPPAETTTEAVPAAPPAASAAPPTTIPPTTGAAAPAQQTAQATMADESLDPMLLVAGLVAAVTIICLLLMTARPEQ